MELVAETLGEETKQKLVASTEPFKTLAGIILERNTSLQDATTKLTEAEVKLGKLELASKLTSRAQQIRDTLSLDADSQERVDNLVASTTTLDDDSFGVWLDNTKELFSLAKFVPFAKKDEKDKSKDDESEDKKDKKGKASSDCEGVTDVEVLETAQASASAPSGGTENAGTPVTLEEKMSALASVLLGNSQKKKEA